MLRFSIGSLKKGLCLASAPSKGSRSGDIYHKITDAAGEPVSLDEFGSPRAVAKSLSRLKLFYGFNYGCIRFQPNRALYYLERE